MAALAPPAALTTRAPAKVNLTLAVHGRRDDGHHDLTSLVAFAGVGDEISLLPSPRESLAVAGPFAAGLETGPDNLVLRAARHLRERAPGLRSGAFRLLKRLPVASGIGGGSADAAAALRLLARLNGLPLSDPRLMAAARATGADVPVCLASRSRIMAGVGDELHPPLRLPRLFAVLVNPGVGVSTAQVFARLGLKPGERLRHGRIPNRAARGWTNGRTPPTAFERCDRAARQRPRGAGAVTSARDRRGARRPARHDGLPARADVGLRRDLLRPVRRLPGERGGGAGDH